ncbi:nuclear transport factor 2 family protein [Oceanobacillus rekensis]|uniref:nuclear transport factor 2 family protein n=1 Tax=Oceanobacillus rekensis TaxID=937927 RepID=UPI000B42D718|nr:nuclear transport factor 2 family protein [Oceanobacillus rekensis]
MSTDNQMKKQSNRKEISEVFSQFAKAYETGELTSIKHLFLKDAKASLSNHGNFEGREAIIEGLSSSLVPVDVARHYVTNEYIAVATGVGQQSAYLTGILADDLGERLDPSWYSGHYTNTYEHTDEGWKIAAIRFELDWKIGNHSRIRQWEEPIDKLGWNPNVKLPHIISGLDAPWHVIPHSEEKDSNEVQILDVFTRYTWAVDQWDIGLLGDILTDDIATNVVPFGEVTGRREFMTTLQTFRTGRVNLHHVIGDYRIEINGDKAKLQVYRLVPYNVSKELLDKNIYGATYNCSLRREEGVWKLERFDYTEGELFEV